MVLALCSSFLAKTQTPVLNSYTSANAVMLLDFDGHLVSGTSWNVSGPINCSSSGLSSVAQITEVFNRVAEDFRPFNINITTEELALKHPVPSHVTFREVLMRIDQQELIDAFNEWASSYVPLSKGDRLSTVFSK